MPARRRQQDVVGHSIGVAAQLVGMHPQTLREYERQGLVQPARTDGGTRRYRDREIERLRRIQQLTELGMSLAAVAHVLALEDRLGMVVEHVRRLEATLLGLGQPVPAPPEASGLARRAAGEPRATAPTPRVRGSVSVEIVHVPRQPRSPRWRNS